MNKHAATPSLADPLLLPCGALVKNRIAKAAMSDSLGNGSGDPTDAQARLYARWAQGGIGLSIVGEVQVDPRYPEKPGNLIVDSSSESAAFHTLTKAGAENGSVLWAQLGHAGALADPALTIGVGPSELNIGDFHCGAMTDKDIAALPEKYAQAALRSKTLGFGGVEIHAAHGFLLSQFLSPLFNLRTDNYGGDVRSRARIVIEIIDAVRQSVGPDFPVGIKLNSSDGLEGGLSEEDSLVVIGLIDATSIDLIDISGGTYFPGAKSASESVDTSGAYFASFARKAKQLTTIPIMLTGGFKHEFEAIEALARGDADLIGLGRTLVIDPELPTRWINNVAGTGVMGMSDPVFPRFDSPPPGGITAWYTMRLTALADAQEANMSIFLHDAISEYEQRDSTRRALWQKRLVSGT